MAEENFSGNYDNRKALIDQMAEIVYERIKSSKDKLQRPESGYADKSQQEWLMAEFDILAQSISETIRGYKNRLPR